MTQSDELTLEINPEDQKTFGPCDCCGQMTSRVWGYVNRNSGGLAAYFVEWTPGHEDSQANFDIIVGMWGEGTHASDRYAVCLEFRQLESGPAFMIIDAESRPIKASSLISKALSRTEVMGTQLALEIFRICDTIFLHDTRIHEITVDAL